MSILCHRITSSPRYRLVGALSVLWMAGCAPSEEVVPVSPITEALITEQELIEGRDDPGHDRVEPWAGIDGDVSRLAPRAMDPPEGSSDEGVVSRADALQACSPTTGYSRGTPVRICVTTVDGKLVEYRTAEAFLRMRSAASRDGVNITINSGFRTMEQQRSLYAAYRAGRGNLAAAPGYSNHQSGLALDLSTGGGASAWLARHGNSHGFRRTVPSEVWHWERPAGSQGSFTSTGRSDATCHSQTLERNLPERTCVQSRFDENWYQCVDGAWRAGRGTHGACAMSYPLVSSRPVMAMNPCQSSTLNRQVPFGTCLQSRLDNLWYQCGNTGWTFERALPGASRGSAGACTSSVPLR